MASKKPKCGTESSFFGRLLLTSPETFSDVLIRTLNYREVALNEIIQFVYLLWVSS